VSRVRRAAVLLALTAGLLAASGPAASAAGPPVIESSWVSRVTATDLEARGMVNPNGLATTGRARYITEAAYQANLADGKDGFEGAIQTAAGALGSGEAPVQLIRTVLALQPETKYHWRLVASNSAGTVEGPVGWFRTEESAPVFKLPDRRGWEMVSPVDKNGGAVAWPGKLFGGGVLQAAAGGGAVTYGSASVFAAPLAASTASQYVSVRGAGGWDTANVTVPAQTGSFGDEPEGVPYQLFSTDLARALVADPQRCEAAPCPRGYLLRNTADGSLRDTVKLPDLAFAGASPDLSTVVLSTCAALTPDATEAPGEEGGCDPAEPNLYRWDGTSLTLLNLLPGEATGTPGARLAAPGAGSVSPDGSRVFFTLGGDLYLRQGATTTQLDAELGGGGTFEAAAGAYVYLSKGERLYRKQLGGSAVDLTPGGDFEGLLGASADGSVAYLQAGGAIARVALGAASQVVAGPASAGNFPPATGEAQVSADGGLLAFTSEESLTGFENWGESEVFAYVHATGSLVCVSCNPTGERPLGPSRIPGARANGSGPGATRAYKPRALLADGSRLYFDSLDSLAPQDTNNDWDVYQWTVPGAAGCGRPDGCLHLISSGRSEEGAVFLDASADGGDVFFITDESLVITDPGSVDVYDARVGGGFPVPPTPLPCIGDACQVVPPEPDDPTPGTALQRPEGNPPVTFPGRRKASKKKAKRGKRKAKKRAQAKRRRQAARRARGGRR